ncbi:MAG TPA: hypothetical protein VGN57_23225 [Pirellulaceae bacterium]|nr:hypothetical protein [Pirellulaceae bacterium]
MEYDFDLSRENLNSPEAFRGLRYKEPSFKSGGALVERLLATLRDVRDAPSPPVPVGQAVPDDAEETSAGEEGGSREVAE